MNKILAKKPYFTLDQIFLLLYCTAQIVLHSDYYDHDLWLVNSLPIIVYNFIQTPNYIQNV